jgi:hypothetical protein
VAAETRPLGTRAAGLPIELRAGLDLIVLRSADRAGRPTGDAVGLPDLVEEWRRYGWSGNGAGLLIALGASPGAIRAIVGEAAPQWVITLQAGPIARLLRPIRASAVDLPEGLPPTAWRGLGYQPSWTAGLFGVGAVAWAIAERVLRRAGRPDLADRCRLGMLRSLKTSPIGRLVAVSHVWTYHRVTA